MILEVCWDGLWTLSFGLSQSHGSGSWLVCEVALSLNLVQFDLVFHILLRLWDEVKSGAAIEIHFWFLAHTFLVPSLPCPK